MRISVTIGEQKLLNAIYNVEVEICKEWFDGNRDAYEDWAGDRLPDALDSFLIELAKSADIQIDTFKD